MKKRILVLLLSCVSALSLLAGCVVTVDPNASASDPNYTQTEKTWGEGYEPTSNPRYTVDAEISVDGKLDEEFWASSEAFYFESKGEDIAKKGELYVGFQDGSISIKTYFGEENLYFGVEVKDPVLYKTGDTSKIWQETCLEFYIATPDQALVYDAKQLWLAPDGHAAVGDYVRTNAIAGFMKTSAKNVGAVATIDGDGLCKQNNVGYTLEGLVSWADLGLTEKPEYIRLYPCMIRVREIPKVAGAQQQCWHNVAEQIGSTYGEAKTWLKFKDQTGYQSRPKQQDISTYDPSAFANYPTKTVNEWKGNRSLSYNGYYVKGEGLWVNAEAHHNTYGSTGSFADCTNFEVQVEGKQSYIYASDGLIWTVGFDEEKSMMWTVKNANGAPTKYSSYLIGFIPDEALLEMGVTQNILDRGWFQFTGAFKTAGEKMTFNEGGEPVAPDWWRTETLPMGESGFFATKGATKSVQFTDTTTKKMFSYSAVLNEYGLYIEAEVKTNSTDANLFLGVEYVGSLYSSPVTQFYGAQYGIGNPGTYKHVRKISVASENKAEVGVNYHVYYYVFMSYDALKAEGISYGLNEQNLIESAIYINPVFKAEDDSMEFTYLKGDGTLATRKSASPYGWALADEYNAVEASTIGNLRQKVTKNGIVG
ncbi:MAG: hypothetical protein IKJ19_02265 [Clostridia bacterium]|nr:hypothetical protein [Clostridia bacterium]